MIREHYNTKRRKQFLYEKRSILWNKKHIAQRDLHEQWVTPLQSHYDLMIQKMCRIFVMIYIMFL